MCRSGNNYDKIYKLYSLTLGFFSVSLDISDYFYRKFLRRTSCASGKLLVKRMDFPPLPPPEVVSSRELLMV